MTVQTSYDPWLGKHYPASALANDRCHACYYYSAKTISCDYYIKTGRRKNASPPDCNKYLPRKLVKQPKRHPWYESLKQ